MTAQAQGWRDGGLSLYPQAGEAGGSFRYSTPCRAAGGEGDPDRARTEAARRARGKVRRYCAANRLNRLGTLTYRGDGCHDPRELRRHVGCFRYEVAQGFQPEVVRIHGRTAGGVICEASEQMGASPARVWSSADENDWRGPPAVWASWAG